LRTCRRALEAFRAKLKALVATSRQVALAT
jgi:hypothetical protein